MYQPISPLHSPESESWQLEITQFPNVDSEAQEALITATGSLIQAANQYTHGTERVSQCSIGLNVVTSAGVPVGIRFTMLWQHKPPLHWTPPYPWHLGVNKLTLGNIIHIGKFCFLGHLLSEPIFFQPWPRVWILRLEMPEFKPWSYQYDPRQVS